MEKSLSKSLDTIKVYSVLLVLIGHVVRMYTPVAAFPQQETWLTSQLCSLIYSFHMPLFIMVSGAVYGICISKGKYKSWKEILMNKYKRLLVPYFTFGILVLAPCMIYTSLANNYLKYCILDILGGGNVRHLWYLLSLFELFIISHIIRKKIDSIPWYIVMVSCVIFSIIYRHLISIPYLQISGTINYLPYFLFGYYIGQNRINISISNKLTILVFMLSIIMHFMHYRLPSYTFAFSNYIIAFGFILVTLNISRKYNLADDTYFHNIIKRDGMGIYLWHVIVIYIAYYHNAFQCFGMYGQLITITLLSITLSIFLTMLTRKLRLSFMLGE